MNFGNFSLDKNNWGGSLASLGESFTRDIQGGIEQLKKGVEEAVRQQDDQQADDQEDDQDAWGFGAIGIDSLVKNLVGGGEEDEGEEEEEEEEEEEAEEAGEAEEAEEKEEAEEAEAAAAPAAVLVPDDAEDPAVDRVVRAADDDEPRVEKGAMERGAMEPAQSAADSPRLVEHAEAAASRKEAAPAPAPPTAHEERIRELEQRVATQAKELAIAKRRAMKERQEKQGAETRLKSKHEEVREVMAEGEALSKKQLALETMVKDLKTQLAASQRDLAAREAALQEERQRNEDATSLRADHESTLLSMKAEHEATVKSMRADHVEAIKMLRSELVDSERKLANLSKDGSSDARKLRDAQNRASALQESLEEARDEMRRQRQSADEQQEMLQSEIAALQRRCSEAEARHKDSESKLPEATAPLLAQVESLRKKLEDQDALSTAAQKRLVEKIESLEKTVEALQREKRALVDETEEATSRYESLYAQLSGAQQRASDAERASAEERVARKTAEASLAAAQAELASIDSGFSARIDALTSTEVTLKKTIRDLEEELIRERSARANTGRDAAETADIADAAEIAERDRTATKALPSSPQRIFAADGSDSTLRRKIRELEETRDKLSSALVEAEQRAASGDAANRELADVWKKLMAASEVVGEREETIDELRADLADIKEILASQQDELARSLSERPTS